VVATSSQGRLEEEHCRYYRINWALKHAMDREAPCSIALSFLALGEYNLFEFSFPAAAS